MRAFMLIIAVVMLAAGPLAPAWAYSAEEAHRIYLEARDARRAGDFNKALRLIKPLAEAGYAEAQHLMGYLYEQGEGVPRDTVVAHSWYEKAARKGSLKSLHNLGLNFLYGDGVNTDFVKAEKYLKKSAEGGNTSSYVYLGQALYHLEDRQYRVWLHKAADSGSKSAIFLLALYGDREQITRLTLGETFCFAVRNMLPDFMSPKCE
ncbi:tetratricopeptide repeat protein [Magnetospira sp. QH-2]|uniref:tetratricopeptide repeat protein n=1 Tax=Magnetospira sp. (strain QH-2) TaxID=1288970 RepID=UPI0003E81653|nr:tetratricopeptide repeat protein [Magnetospira sp. QH-2]CCQ75686.1 exported protein of unknown function[Include Sel1 domain] [Magnetospira sp. QH-2]